MTLPIISPCPFCGAKPSDPDMVTYADSVLGPEVDCNDDTTDNAVVGVRCYGCGADGPSVPLETKFRRRPQSEGNLVFWRRAFRAAQIGAIEKWNRRVS